MAGRSDDTFLPALERLRVNRRRRLRTLRYLFEAAFAWGLYYFFRVLPLDTASAIGGWVCRTLGPLHSVTTVARQNINRALPELSVIERESVIIDMWDNLGRVAAEFPHLTGKDISSRITLEGKEHVDAVHAMSKTVMCITGHLGNWEIAPKIAAENGLRLTLVYRPANNPWVDRMFRRVRSPYYADMFAKGAARAIRIAKSIQQGHPIGMLADQKMNDGIAVPFFGRDAMTATAPAALALKFNMVILPVHVIRHAGARFTMKVSAPYIPTTTGDNEADIARTTLDINKMLETWIREKPGQWFWLHNRWPKS